MRRALPILAVLLLAAIGSAGPRPGGQADATPQDPERQALEQRLQAARELATVEGDSKRATLIQAYSAALSALDNAAQWRARAAEFMAAAEAAPARTLEIERALADDAPGTPTFDGLTLEDLERRQVEARAERDRAKAEVDRLETAQLGAPDRRREIAQLLADLVGRVEQYEETLRVGALPDEDPELAAARLAQVRAQRDVTAAHADALRTEEQTYQVRTDLVALELRLARRELARREAALQAVDGALLAERLADTERQKRAAEESRRAALMQGVAFSMAADETLALREQSVTVARQLEEIAAEVGVLREELSDLERRFAETKRRVDILGLTNPISLHLRQERRRLIEARASLLSLRDVQQELTSSQVDLLERSIELDAIDEEDEWIGTLVDDAVEGGKSAEEALPLARQLYEDRFDALRANREILETKFDRLVELDVARRELVEKLEEYDEYVEERVLWIRSAKPVWRVPAADYTKEVRAAANVEGWRGVLVALRREAGRNPVIFYGAIVLVLAVLGLRGRARRSLAREGELAEQRQQVSIRPTLRALAWTVLLTLGFGAPLIALGALLRSAFVDEPLVASLGMSCERAIAAALILGGMRALTLKGGLGESHFEWGERVVTLIRRQATLLLPITPLAALVGDFLLNVDVNTNADAMSRIAFAVESGSVLFFVYRVLHPSRGVLALSATGPSAGELVFRLRRAWFLLAVGVTGALVLLALVGYGFTARSLFGRFEFTFAFVLVLLVVRAIALRWISLARRSEALERRRKRRDEERQKRLAEIERRRDAGENVEELESEGLVVEEETPDFAALSEDVRDLVRLLTGFAAIAGIIAIWTAVLPALGFFDSVDLWQREVSFTEYLTNADGTEEATTKTIIEDVTLANLGLAALVLLFAWVVITNLTAVLELLLFRRFELPSGERYAIATLLQYLITIVALAVAFDQIGLSWGKLQWLVAGVSVGLGFGLQEIFANFVSGITLLFERPVRVGDWVTLGDVEGVVSRIRIRATTIRDRDLKELIVPNREFITGRFINWTLSDPVSRVTVPVGIAYGSDTEEAIRQLLESGRACSFTVDDPAPNVVFTGFGDSSLDFELRVFVSGRESYPRVVHDLHMRVDAAFRAAGVEISFPQRDLHVRSARGLDAFAPGTGRGAPAADSN